jgi:hypothetical protein
MSPGDLRTYLLARPFKPFRITMTSGQTYDVRHPEMVAVSPTHTAAMVALDTTEDGPSFELISLNLIENIKDLETAPARGDGQGA